MRSKGIEMKAELRRLFVPTSAIGVTAMCVAGARADTWIPFGTSTGGVAVYYNPGAQELPQNVSYYRAQFNNSTTSLNGAGFTFANAPVDFGSVFGNSNQFGLDLIKAAPTNTGTVPTLTAYDNTNNTIAGRSSAGSVAWAINNYFDTTQAPPSGPGNPNQSVVNSVIRGNGVNFTIGSVTPIQGGFQTTFSGTLTSDDIVHWYNPAFVEGAISSYDFNGMRLDGTFRFSGTLTYLTGTDTTPGMDFYAGSVNIEAELVPLPPAAWAGVGGLGIVGFAGAIRRRRIGRGR